MTCNEPFGFFLFCVISVLCRLIPGKVPQDCRHDCSYTLHGDPARASPAILSEKACNYKNCCIFVTLLINTSLIMDPFLYVISIVWTVLCLILFFKVWGMCNDVSKIKRQLDRNDDFSTKIDFLLNIGEKEKAKEIFLSRILSDDSIFNTTSTPVEKMEELYNKYADEFENLGIKIKKEAE